MKFLCNKLRRLRKCGSSIFKDRLQGDFLASFSDSLLDRVRRLDRDLSLAEINLKNAKNSRDDMKKRLQAYEDFVAGILSSVDDRGAVQFTDEKGHKVPNKKMNIYFSFEKRDDRIIFEKLCFLRSFFVGWTKINLQNSMTTGKMTH